MTAEPSRRISRPKLLIVAAVVAVLLLAAMNLGNFLYEDDPLRQELAQQIEAPSIRRSSRYLDYEDEEY